MGMKQEKGEQRRAYKEASNGVKCSRTSRPVKKRGAGTLGK